MMRCLLVLATCLPGLAWAGLLVTDLSGQAEIDGRGALRLMAEVPDGSLLIVGPAAHLVGVDLSSGLEYVLAAGRYTIEKSGPKAQGNARVASSALPDGQMPPIKLATGRVAQATLVMRSVRKPVTTAVSPHNTAVLTVSPQLRWPEESGATRQRLTIEDLATQLAVFQATVPSAPTFLLPENAGLKPGGYYRWRVVIEKGGQAVAEHGGEFSVLSSEASARLARFRPAAGAEFSRRTLYAALLMEAGANEEARSVWQVLREERPDDASLKKLAEP